MADKCAACKNRPLANEHDIELQLCAICADNLGVIAMPPARRKFAPCRCCSGTAFVRAIPREVGMSEKAAVVSPMAVTFGAQQSGWLNQDVVADVRRVAGVLEMYVCRACGYVEWYCTDPQAIPIGPQFMTELVGVEDGKGPYR
jgi:hypothetical protein